jgi:small subunit ribosomal protein S21
MKDSRRLQDVSRISHNNPSRRLLTPLVYVIIQQNESIDSGLKRFNMKLQQSGVLRDLKEHAHYEKPSEKRRRQKRRRASQR